MIAEVFGIFPSTADAESAVIRIKRAGISASVIEVLPVSAEKDFGLSTRRGVLGGAILGACMGLALVLYSNSTAFNHWGGAISLPISGAVGWALYGWILGGTGLLAGPPESESEAWVSLQLSTPNQLDKVETVLYEAGASEVRSIGPEAA
jgi:hypothetical protein